MTVCKPSADDTRNLKTRSAASHTTPQARLWRVLVLAIGLFLLWSSLSQVNFDLFKRRYTAKPKEVVGTVKWWECEGPGHVPGAECGYIIVPLDYHNVTAGVAKVALGRYKATSGPRKGMVLYNPGGPGGAGKPVATTRGSFFQAIIGKEYDFVSFDPRGVGDTEPRVNCFGDPQNYQMFRANTILERGFDVGPNLTEPLTRDRLIMQQVEAESLYKTQFDLCDKTMGDSLKYMGTSTVSRDIDFITTSLEGENALINFYGASYGSVLGIYLVNMFPDRVGRVVIDGIVDAVSWSNVPSYKWYNQWLTNTEDVYLQFLDGCSKAGPPTCPLAKSKNENTSKIEGRIEEFFAQLYSKPLAVPHAKRPSTLTSGRARIAVFEALQAPSRWPAAAIALAQAMQGDGAGLLDQIREYLRDLERSAVSCNDNAPYSGPPAEEVIDESLHVLSTVTRFGMSVITAEPDSGCQFWPVTPPERFLGPWNHTLSNPILIHSNTADPVTPMANGRLMKQLLGNSSRLALQDGPGHTSFALASLCTVKITQNYFKDGTLPPDGHMCPVDDSPFPDADSTQVFTGEDAELLQHVRIAGDAMSRVRRGLPL